MDDKLNFKTAGKEYVKIVGKKFFLGKDKEGKPSKICYFTYLVLIPKSKPVEEVAKPIEEVKKFEEIKQVEKFVETPEKKIINLQK